MNLRGANPAQVANSLIAFLMNDSVGKVIAARKRWFHKCHRWSLQWLVNSPLYLMCQWNCACCLYGCPPLAHLRHMPIKFLVCCISLRNITHVVLKLFKLSSSLVINWHHLVVDVPGDGDGNPEPKAPILGVELQQRHSWGGCELCCMKVRPTVTWHYLILNWCARGLARCWKLNSIMISFHA